MTVAALLLRYADKNCGAWIAVIFPLHRPKCKDGRVHISSRDPLAPPVIDLALLCDPNGMDWYLTMPIYFRASLDFAWASKALDDLLSIIKRMSEIDPSISFVYPTADILAPEYIYSMFVCL